MVRLANNVHVSGQVLQEVRTDSGCVNLMIGVATADINTLLPIWATVDVEKWKLFKSNFPDFSSVTISGQLQYRQNPIHPGEKVPYIIGESVSCFHNELADLLDESKSEFRGVVRLRKKFNFGGSSSLHLIRMLFETTSTPSVSFEATALRGAAPYFDEIGEGEKVFLKADYVLDQNGNPPYWRIKHRPEAIA